MPTRSPEIITRASQIDEDLVPEPWQRRDPADARALVAERERYRLQGVTDEQGAGIVPAYNLNVADTEAIPLVTQDGWTRGSAGRVLGPNGKYVSKGSDVPRLSYDGEEPGLLVEASQRTNLVKESNDLSAAEWDNLSADTVKSFDNSIIKGETASRIEGNESAEFYTDIGTLSNSDEVAYAIIEKDGHDTAAIKIKNNTVGGRYKAGYEFSTDTASSNTFNSPNGILKSVNVRRLSESGPNGGPVALLQLRYNGTQGDARRVRIENGTGGLWIHHVQVEQSPNASSPIVTSGSAVTRAGDSYSISDTGWLNSNEGTFLFLIEPRAFTSGFDRIFSTVIFSGIGTYRFDNSQGQNSDLSSNLNGPFEFDLLALSGDQSEWLSSCNGQSGNSKSDQFGLLTRSTFTIGSNVPFLLGKVIYFPRKFSQSTLNTLTS